MTALTGTPGGDAYLLHQHRRFRSRGGVPSQGSRVQGLGFRVWGLGFGVWGLGLGLRLFWVSETILVILEAERLQKS